MNSPQFLGILGNKCAGHNTWASLEIPREESAPELTLSLYSVKITGLEVDEICRVGPIVRLVIKSHMAIFGVNLQWTSVQANSQPFSQHATCAITTDSVAADNCLGNFAVWRNDRQLNLVFSL